MHMQAPPHIDMSGLWSRGYHDMYMWSVVESTRLEPMTRFCATGCHLSCMVQRQARVPQISVHTTWCQAQRADAAHGTHGH
jgi:hypothetical protein